MRRQEVYGTKSDAYKAAGLNSATWSRIEEGEVVREDRLIAAIRTLWPDSGGDWTAIGADGGLGAPVFGGSYNDPDYMANLESWLLELTTRLEALEGYVARQKEDEEEGGGDHEDLADPAEKSRGEGVTLTTRSDLSRAARHADVPDKDD